MQADCAEKLRWDRAMKLAAANRRLAFRTSQALRIDFEDAQQELLIWIFEALKSYDPTRGASENTYIRTAHVFWLSNRIRNQSRKVQLVCGNDPSYLPDPEYDDSCVDDMADLALVLDRAELSENERRAVDTLLENVEPRTDITRQGQHYWTKRAIKKLQRKTR